MCTRSTGQTEAGEAATQFAPAVGSLTVTALNDHILCFYAGRDPAAKRALPQWNWYDDAAMKLGIASYVVHRANTAVVYDSFTSPAHARWIRNYLEAMGIKRLSVVLSHWHLDHVAGNAIYADVDIIASALTRRTLCRDRSEIEGGRMWGPPAIDPLVLPNLTFEQHMDVYVEDIKLELHNVNIHSADTTVIYLPAEKLLLAGDAVEDCLTYMVEVESLATHVANLKQLRQRDIARIYPNHGDLAVLEAGGYDKTLIDATIAYISRVLARAHDDNFTSGAMDEYIAEEARKRWVRPYHAYNDVHAQNLRLVHEHYRDKRLPDLGYSE